MKFENPIIPGFAPDPSVVFVDGTFFLVNSSFHIFPGLPIYASEDLNSWVQVGNAINRPEQLSLDNANIDGFPLGPGKTLIAAQGLLAPSIRWHKGVFYVICTNSRSDGTNLTMKNFYVSTTDIWSDKWSDPIWFDFQGIDPSLFFDDDDRAYVQGSWRAGPVFDPQCTIRQLEIDIKSGSPLSETKEIWKGFAEKQDAEGPHIYKKDGYYYLIAAEAGTFEHHMITAARSKTVWGPYESYEKNPILTAFEKNVDIQHTGHGELFQDGNGAWWAVALGVRNLEGSYTLGRETFLMPVSWPKDQWPQLDQPRLTFERDSATSALSKPLPASRANAEYIYIRNPKLTNYQFSPEDGTIQISASQTDLSVPLGTTSFVGKRQLSLNSSATTTLQFPAAKGVKAGLAMYKEDFRHAEIFYDFSTLSICASVVNRLKAEPKLVSRPLLPSGNISFKIQCTPDSYDFLFQEQSEKNWVSLVTVKTLDMTAYDFTGPIYGVFATLTNGESSGIATFKDFNVS